MRKGLPATVNGSARPHARQWRCSSSRTLSNRVRVATPADPRYGPPYSDGPAGGQWPSRQEFPQMGAGCGTHGANQSGACPKTGIALQHNGVGVPSLLRRLVEQSPCPPGTRYRNIGFGAAGASDTRRSATDRYPLRDEAREHTVVHPVGSRRAWNPVRRGAARAGTALRAAGWPDCDARMDRPGARAHLRQDDRRTRPHRPLLGAGQWRQGRHSRLAWPTRQCRADG